MSEIDFDALRDPDVPRPGDRERDGVRARARQLRTRSRVNRLALSSVSVVAVLALVLGIVASQRDNRPELTVGGSNTTAASSVADRFVPPTSIDNGVVTLPVTLPDGATTTLTYPEDLRIAQLGFAGGIGVDWPADTGTLRCCGKQISIRYATIADVYGNATPIKVYPGANGEDVPYFRASQQIPPQPNPLNYLVFQFGPWLVQVYDVQQAGDFERPMSDAQRATWARSLTGTLDENGYLLLHTEPPLALAHDFDGLFGAPTTGTNQLELASHVYCGGSGADSNKHRRFTQGDGTPGVAWCNGELHVSATGSAAFVGGVDRGLQVSDLIPPTTSTTTTTTPPVVPSSPAVSATFVSPDHGWVLQRNGNVAETTDDGATWRRVGNVGVSPATGIRVRFADPDHGFVYDQNRLFTTGDGGATWVRAVLPATPAFDLEVSRGTVYTVAFDSAASGFHIWSSPADQLAWTEDPLQIQPGAGPIASFQFVFSGGSGWLLYVDRVVISGARLTSTGRWGPWGTPPCTSSGGSAFLAASSPTDLVASCQEGAYTGPRVTNGIYFSHDGGATFARRAAPASGSVLMPNPQTAIVEGDQIVQRTTDDGATWTTLNQLPTNDTTDWGFTTSSKGFIVIGGQMLTTYDAGATWQKVTLP